MLQTRRLCSGSAIGSSRKDAWLAGKRLKVDYFRVFVFFLFFWPNDLVGFLRWANMSFLFFWPRTHCMLHMRCLVVLSFFFRELRIYLCLVFSFLLFHSHLFPSAFGGFWIWLQTRKPVLSWVMFSFCFYIILRSLIVFPCWTYFCICLSILISGVSILKVCNFGKVANNQ